MTSIGKQVLISYRGSYYEYAATLGQWLVDNKYCTIATVFPPNSLCERYELLLPYEYVELMEFILDRLARVDAFVILNTPDYEDSYFTQAEVLQWRRFQDDPVVYTVGSGGNEEFIISEPIRLEPLTKNEKKLWAKLSVSIARSYKSKMNPGFYGGKYNRSCFIFPCGNCGEHFLVTKKAVYKAIKKEFSIICPHCGNREFRLREGEKTGKYYRKPLILEQDFKRKLRVLGSDEIVDLLLLNELPPMFKLVSLNGETLRSDFAKLGWFYLGLGVLGVGALAISSWFASKIDDDKNSE